MSSKGSSRGRSNPRTISRAIEERHNLGLGGLPAARPDPTAMPAEPLSSMDAAHSRTDLRERITDSARSVASRNAENARHRAEEEERIAKIKEKDEKDRAEAAARFIEKRDVFHQHEVAPGKLLDPTARHAEKKHVSSYLTEDHIGFGDGGMVAKDIADEFQYQPIQQQVDLNVHHDFSRKHQGPQAKAYDHAGKDHLGIGLAFGENIDQEHDAWDAKNAMHPLGKGQFLEDLKDDHLGAGENGFGMVPDIKHDEWEATKPVALKKPESPHWAVHRDFSGKKPRSHFPDQEHWSVHTDKHKPSSRPASVAGRSSSPHWSVTRGASAAPARAVSRGHSGRDHTVSLVLPAMRMQPDKMIKADPTPVPKGVNLQGHRDQVHHMFTSHGKHEQTKWQIRDLRQKARQYKNSPQGRKLASYVTPPWVHKNYY